MSMSGSDITVDVRLEGRVSSLESRVDKLESK
jgi:hypothetical protein